jgi:hypothetical protein
MVKNPQPPVKRERNLSADEARICAWIKENHGVLSRVARSMQPPLSVQFVARIAYNQNAKSKGFHVERKLKALGCPLIQRIG